MIHLISVLFFNLLFTFTFLASVLSATMALQLPPVLHVLGFNVIAASCIFLAGTSLFILWASIEWTQYAWRQFVRGRK